MDSTGIVSAEAGSRAVEQSPEALSGVAWWAQMNDPAIDRLVAAAMASNPTLDEAVAKIEEARANLGTAEAASGPSLIGSGFEGKAKAQVGASNATAIGNARTANLNFNWEIDLFGKVRESRAAASRRIEARSADSALAKLSLAAQVVSGVVGTRACLYSLQVRESDIASRKVVLELIKAKRAGGFAPSVSESRALADIASSQTAQANQQNACAKGLNELVYLTGAPLDTIKEYLSENQMLPTEAPMQDDAPASSRESNSLPATVLRFHPRVRAAERDAAAAYAEIAVARAARYPAISLSAILGGQWLRANGQSVNTSTWSIGPSVTGAILDGGASASNVDAALARWQLAVGVLNNEIRNAAQDVQNALADRQSAAVRVQATSRAVSAALDSLRATEVQWRAGAVSLFELQDANRQYESSQEAEIVALRDRSQAWVALIKATANVSIPLRDSE